MKRSVPRTDRPYSRRRRFVGLHLGLLALLLAGFAWRFRDFAIDDFFITYRYSLHLAEGQGFRFNPDEAVFGTTAPGFALLLAGLRWVTGAPLPLLGTLVTALSLLTVCALLLWETAPRRRWEGVLGAWLIASAPLLWLHTGGELITVAALLMVAGHLAERGMAARPPAGGSSAADSSTAAGPGTAEPGTAGPATSTGLHWSVLSGILAGLAVWCRPDAALGVAALGSWLWIRGRRLPQGFGWSAAATIGAGLLAARAWFGRFFPETLEAKHLQAEWMPWVWPGGADFWPAFLETAHRFTAVLPLVLLGVVGAAAAFRHGGGAVRALLLWAGSLVVGYPLLGVGLYAWYGIAPVMALSVGSAFAAGAAGRALLRYLEGPPPDRSRGSRAAAGALAVLLLFPLLRNHAGQVRPFLAGQGISIRLDLYRETGQLLARHAPPDARVAAAEVGVLGFYSQRHVHDMLGLVSPEALPFVATGDMLGAFRAGDPDHLVWYSPLEELLDPVLQSPGFADRWAAVARLESPAPDVFVVIYRRSDAGGDGPPDPPAM